MSRSIVAILEILDEYCYEKALCINADEEIESALKVRCKSVMSINIQKRSTLTNFVDGDFDLIISFSDNKSLISELSNICNDNSEILIISHNLLSYNLTGQKIKIFDRRLRGSFFYQLNKYFRSFSKLNYYPFPDIYKPEMILTKNGLNNYFRYWSWKQFSKSLLERFFEYLLVNIFRSPIFSPHIIVKLKHDSSRSY